jgi:uncharacterized protein
VIKALEKSKQMLILHHIDHHLAEASGSLSTETRDQIAKFREITKYL